MPSFIKIINVIKFILICQQKNKIKFIIKTFFSFETLLENKYRITYSIN